MKLGEVLNTVKKLKETAKILEKDAELKRRLKGK
jgi:hypothetical protein